MFHVKQWKRLESFEALLRHENERQNLVSKASLDHFCSAIS
jgi:hypothetical protein